MRENNIQVVEKCKETLLETPLVGWIELIERTATTIHLSDKSSVQKAINEFVQAYGQIENLFITNLFLP
jgi:hypothetical protein